MPHPALKRIALDADLYRRLRRMAVRQGRSLTNLGNLLLRRCLGMSASPPKVPPGTAGPGPGRGPGPKPPKPKVKALEVEVEKRPARRTGKPG